MSAKRTMSTKKIAYIGMLIALAFVFSYIEFLIPLNLGIPGVKPGFSNIVIMVCLYTLGAAYAFLLSLVRIVLVAFTFGNLSAMLYSLAGGILSLLVMLMVKRLKLFSMSAVSVLGGVFHNLGQIIMASFLLETSALIYYLPVLMVSGIVSGMIVGLLSALITGRIKSYVKNL